MARACISPTLKAQIISFDLQHACACIAGVIACLRNECSSSTCDLFSVELAEILTSGRVLVLNIITFAQLHHRHNSLPQPQPQLPACLHHSCIAACSHLDSCKRALLWLSIASAVEIRDINYFITSAVSRATIVTIHVKDDSRMRERLAFLHFCCRVGGATPVGPSPWYW